MSGDDFRANPGMAKNQYACTTLEQRIRELYDSLDDHIGPTLSNGEAVRAALRSAVRLGMLEAAEMCDEEGLSLTAPRIRARAAELEK